MPESLNLTGVETQRSIDGSDQEEQMVEYIFGSEGHELSQDDGLNKSSSGETGEYHLHTPGLPQPVDVWAMKE